MAGPSSSVLGRLPTPAFVDSYRGRHTSQRRTQHFPPSQRHVSLPTPAQASMRGSFLPLGHRNFWTVRPGNSLPGLPGPRLPAPPHSLSERETPAVRRPPAHQMMVTKSRRAHALGGLQSAGRAESAAWKTGKAGGAPWKTTMTTTGCCW